MQVILAYLNWRQRCPSPAEEKYNQAMRESEVLLEHLRNDLRDVAITVIADIISNRANIPYMTTIFEAVEEVNSPIKQVRHRS